MSNQTETIETNENGGMQSALETRYDLIPPEVLKRIAKVYAGGARKYAPNNWKLIDSESHLNHMLNHIHDFRISGNPEDAEHAACRMTMWLYMLESEGKLGGTDDSTEKRYCDMEGIHINIGDKVYNTKINQSGTVLDFVKGRNAVHMDKPGCLWNCDVLLKNDGSLCYDINGTPVYIGDAVTNVGNGTWAQAVGISEDCKDVIVRTYDPNDRWKCNWTISDIVLRKRASLVKKELEND